MSAPAPGGRYVALEIFRAVAAPLVVYSHIVALWMPIRGVSSPVTGVIDDVARQPLQLQQEMGHLAVVLFFLVSGFIISETGVVQRHRDFAVKRLLRVYPALIAAVLLCSTLLLLGAEVLATGQNATVTPFTMLTNMTLVNYVLVPQVILIGVAWTLIIEMIFYVLTFVLLPLLRRVPWAAISVELALIALVVLVARAAGEIFFLFAVSVSYLPVVLLGQISWAVWSRRIPLWAGALLGTAAWLIYVWAGRRDMGRIDDAYELTVLIGFLLFVIGLLCEPKLRMNRVIDFMANRSYSIYLTHGLVAFPIMDAMVGTVPAGLVILVGLVATLVSADLLFRGVERPGQRLARVILRPRRGRHRPGAHRGAADRDPADRDPAGPRQAGPPVRAPVSPSAQR